MRRLPPDPLSMRAVWARRLGWFAAAVTLIGVLAMRFALLPYHQGAVVLGAGAAVALLAFALALAALTEIWNIGARGLRQAMVGFLLSLALLAGPASLGVRAMTTPALNDISTDLADPPNFSRARAALVARAGVVPAASSAAMRAAQRRHYGDIKPLELDLPIDEALPVVNSVIENMGWRVVARQEPSRRGGPARIDAVQTSLVLRLPDDIAVRVTPLLERTRVDIRSVSRFGERDLGGNAARVRQFLAALQLEARGR
jgi:uncharacterized protein (DUF1499 family)